MINIILQDIVAYRVEVPLVWLLSLLLAFYKLGYQVSKRKHSQTSHQIQKLESIVPYRKNPPVKVVQKQKQPTELPFQQSQTSLKRAVSSTSEPVRQRKPEGQYMVSDLLKEKLDLQSKKLHSTSFLEIRIQPSNNLKYMRKIQKHELVTDYELQTQEISTNLIPFKNSPNVALAQPNSCLSVIARQDHTMKLMSPINQQHFVKMNYFGDFMKHKEITSWLTETGRFNKFYRRTKVVGKGGFGCVFRAENIYDQKEYAIKKIIIDGSVKLNQLLQQVSIISKYNHPNIVFYYTCWIQLSSLDQINQLSSYLQSKMHQKTQKASKIQSFDYISQDSGFQFEKISSRSKSRSSAKNKQSQMALVKPIPAKYVNLVNFNTLYIQMELCQGSLYEYLRSRKSLNFAEAFQIIAQLLLGIQFLHSNGVVHRDLKPGNILMNKNKSQVKIGDFGLATFIQSHSQNKMRNKVGTPLYMAPQLNSSVPVAKQNMHLVDIFSLGVIYYELLNEFNACTQHERYQKIHSLQQNNVSFASKQLKEQRKFIKLLTRNENTRPSILEVLQSTEFSILKAKYQI